MVFDIKVILVSKKELRNLLFSGRHYVEFLSLIFKHLVDFSSETIWLERFFGSLQITNSIPNSYKAIKIIYSVMMNCGILEDLAIEVIIFM